MMCEDSGIRESMGAAGQARVKKHFSARKVVSGTEEQLTR